MHVYDLNRKESDRDDEGFADAFFHGLPHSSLDIKHFDIGDFQNPEKYVKTVQEFAESMSQRTYAIIRVSDALYEVFDL